MEIHAYDETYLRRAMQNMGNMLNYAVYALGYSLKEFYRMFLKSDVSDRFADGDIRTLAGMSGTELALAVTGQDESGADLPDQKSAEYWTGWALAFYQWKKNISFQEIEQMISIDDICLMYHPYHEMDVTKFAECMEVYYRALNPDSRLKYMRKKRKLTQKQLAELSGVPLRTVQQYEQRQKDINKAQAAYVVSLAQALSCRVEELLESSL